MPDPAPVKPVVWLDNRTNPHISTLVLIAGIGALNMTIVLPSLPALAAAFGAEYSVIQLAVSGYLAMTAFLQLGIGPLSDRYGRRPVLLVTLGVFLAATLGCLIAPNTEIFLLCRFLQASVAAGFALSRAIVRDTVDAAGSASMIGYVTMGMALMPMFGPIIGGTLQELFGWQAVFIFVFGLGIFVFSMAWADLGETNLETSGSFAEQARAYPELLRSRRFWGYALNAAFASGAFFAFLGGAPIVATEVLGLSPSGFAIAFASLPFGFMCGNFLSGRYSRRMGLAWMMRAGAIVAMFGIALSIFLFWIGLRLPATLFGPIVFVGLGNGLSMPSANAGIVSVRPHLAGSASGLGGALLIGGGAVLSSVTGAMLGPDTGPNPLLLMMFLSSVVSLVAAQYVAVIDRREGALAT